MSHHPSAKRVWTLFEMLAAMSLLGGGCYLLVLGSSNKTATDSLMILPGAVCVAVGGLTLGSAVRSLLWCREMLRRAAKYAAHERVIAERESQVWEHAIRPVVGGHNGSRGHHLGSVN